MAVYPDVATPAGVHDCPGNAREWTLRLYESYPDRSGDGRNDPKAEAPRVVRGGSWVGRSGFARSVACNWPDTGSFYSYVGFRVVVGFGRG